MLILVLQLVPVLTLLDPSPFFHYKLLAASSVAPTLAHIAS